MNNFFIKDNYQESPISFLSKFQNIFFWQFWKNPHKSVILNNTHSLNNFYIKKVLTKNYWLENIYSWQNLPLFFVNIFDKNNFLFLIKFNNLIIINSWFFWKNINLNFLKQFVFLFKRIFNKSHPVFHLVNVSPWPLFTSIATLNLVLNLLKYFYNSESIYFYWSSYFLFLIVFLWFFDVLVESTFESKHTKLVKQGLLLGFVLFVVSEFMLFFSIFWGFFHASLTPLYSLGGVWPPIGIEIINPFKLPFLNTLILLLSGVTITRSHDLLLLKIREFVKSNYKNNLNFNNLIKDFNFNETNTKWNYKDWRNFSINSKENLFNFINFFYYKKIYKWLLNFESLFSKTNKMKNLLGSMLILNLFYKYLSFKINAFQIDINKGDNFKFRNNTQKNTTQGKTQKSKNFDWFFKSKKIYNIKDYRGFENLYFFRYLDTFYQNNYENIDNLFYTKLFKRKNKTDNNNYFFYLNSLGDKQVIFEKFLLNIFTKNNIKIDQLNDVSVINSVLINSKNFYKTTRIKYIYEYMFIYRKQKNYHFITIFLGFWFLFCQLFEYVNSTFNINDSVYGTVFFMSTGFHGCHVLVGASFLLIVWIHINKSYFRQVKNFVQHLDIILFKFYLKFKTHSNLYFNKRLNNVLWSEWYKKNFNILNNLSYNFLKNDLNSLYNINNMVNFNKNLVDLYWNKFLMFSFGQFSYIFRIENFITFEAAAWYWHFVDVVWLFLFIFVYYWAS